MTDQEINVAIAEACGWKLLKIPYAPKTRTYREGTHFFRFLKPSEQEWHISKYGAAESDLDPLETEPNASIPDYANDLNAMHEAEKVLGPDKEGTYLRHLGHRNNNFQLATSTAHQRAEAFLRTLGKWRETPTHE